LSESPELFDYALDNGYSSIFQNPTNIGLTPIGGFLNDLNGTIPGGNQVGQLYNGIDGEGILTATADSIPGIPRVIFTGVDNCWNYYRRDHGSSSMLAVNQTAKVPIVQVLVYFEINPFKESYEAFTAILKGPPGMIKYVFTGEDNEVTKLGFRIIEPDGTIAEQWFVFSHIFKLENYKIGPISIPIKHKVPTLRGIVKTSDCPTGPGIVMRDTVDRTGRTDLLEQLDLMVDRKLNYNPYGYNSTAWVADTLSELGGNNAEKKYIYNKEQRDTLYDFSRSIVSDKREDTYRLLSILQGGACGIRVPEAGGVFLDGNGKSQYIIDTIYLKQGVKATPK